jgi:N-acetylmuramic acid 6-phosphate (MurNAc-6-P) etherase
VCFNPFLKISRGRRPAIVIAPNLGPELLTGSTRLKAGTATKQLLNMITTLAMVRLGKVRSNLMIDLNPANVKLQDRAVRIVQELTAADYLAAQGALERSGWVVAKAVGRLSRR